MKSQYVSSLTDKQQKEAESRAIAEAEARATAERNRQLSAAEKQRAQEIKREYDATLAQQVVFEEDKKRRLRMERVRDPVAEGVQLPTTYQEEIDQWAAQRQPQY